MRPYISSSPPNSVKTYPLWTGSTAVDAAIVLVRFGDFTQLRASLRVDLPHFTHVGESELYSCVEDVVGLLFGGRERSVGVWRSGVGPLLALPGGGQGVSRWTESE